MSGFILETKHLTKEFKGFTAVNDVNLKVQRGHIHALIGPNGAGKTTCFNLLTKFLVPTSGPDTVQWQGHHGRQTGPDRPHGRDPFFPDFSRFPHLTVLENVRIGLQRQLGNSFISGKANVP
jgi:branched-chain amino acid transport system ATP-binding protein